MPRVPARDDGRLLRATLLERGLSPGEFAKLAKRSPQWACHVSAVRRWHYATLRTVTEALGIERGDWMARSERLA